MSLSYRDVHRMMATNKALETETTRRHVKRPCSAGIELDNAQAKLREVYHQLHEWGDADHGLKLALEAKAHLETLIIELERR